jgi:hypothetical protein
MLDAYIIEKIKQEELEKQRQFDEGRRIWLELPQPQLEAPSKEEAEQDQDRGRLIIPLYPEDVEDDAA